MISAKTYVVYNIISKGVRSGADNLVVSIERVKITTYSHLNIIDLSAF